MKILIACGGTGGHINPALAIAEILARKFPKARFLFVGTPDGMEAELVPEAGYEMEFVEAAGFKRKLSAENVRKNIKAAELLFASGSKSKEILRSFQPDLAIGTGGYASEPILHAAQQLHIPTAIHEQNAYPGVTNKLLARKADAVMLNFEEARQYFPHHAPIFVTGLPVRGGIKGHSREEARQKLSITQDMTILSFGGSQGAKAINDVMPRVMAWHLKSDMRIAHIHAYGKNGRESFPAALRELGIENDPRLRVSEYIHDMEYALSAADLIISRAGASTLSELEAAGRASVLIPYPAATENHQYYNAKVLSDAGAAYLVQQQDLTEQALEKIIKEFYESPQKRAEMERAAAGLFRTDTDERIAEVLGNLLRGQP